MEKSLKSNSQVVGDTGVRSGYLDLEANPILAKKRLLQRGFDLAALTPVQACRWKKDTDLKKFFEEATCTEGAARH